MNGMKMGDASLQSGREGMGGGGAEWGRGNAKDEGNVVMSEVDERY